MLLKNILLHFYKIFIKFIYILIMIIFILSIFYNQVQAAQYTEKYSNSSTFDSETYPGYVELIEKLKKDASIVYINNES